MEASSLKEEKAISLSIHGLSDYCSGVRRLVMVPLATVSMLVR